MQAAEQSAKFCGTYSLSTLLQTYCADPLLPNHNQCKSTPAVAQLGIKLILCLPGVHSNLLGFSAWIPS